MCNTCIFLSGGTQNFISTTPGGPEDDSEVQVISDKKRMPITNNDIKIISLMALDLKNTFDR